jgi:hypothetical protein
MAGGPLLPSTIYVGGASGNLAMSYYISTTGNGTTWGAGAFEGIAVLASLASDATAVIQYNLPEVLPSGTLKLRVLALANANSGTAVLVVSDGVTAVGSNIASATMTAESSYSTAWSAVDNLVETKITMSTTPVTNNIFTVHAGFKTSGWTLAQTSFWQLSLVWE